jgi:hypothetical protein
MLEIRGHDLVASQALAVGRELRDRRLVEKRGLVTAVVTAETLADTTHRSGGTLRVTDADRGVNIFHRRGLRCINVSDAGGPCDTLSDVAKMRFQGLTTLGLHRHDSTRAVGDDDDRIRLGGGLAERAASQIAIGDQRSGELAPSAPGVAAHAPRISLVLRQGPTAVSTADWWQEPPGRDLRSTHCGPDLFTGISFRAGPPCPRNILFAHLDTEHPCRVDLVAEFCAFLHRALFPGTARHGS